jgi:hypothetical protein
MLIPNQLLSALLVPSQPNRQPDADITTSIHLHHAAKAIGQSAAEEYRNTLDRPLNEIVREHVEILTEVLREEAEHFAMNELRKTTH